MDDPKLGTATRRQLKGGQIARLIYEYHKGTDGEDKSHMESFYTMRCLETMKWLGDTPDQMRLFNEEWDNLLLLVKQYNPEAVSPEWIRHIYSGELMKSQLLKKDMGNFKMGMIHRSDPKYKDYYSYDYLRDVITARVKYSEAERQNKAIANVEAMTSRLNGLFLKITR